MGATAGTQPLTAETYVTNDIRLLYVLDLPGPGEVMVEDVRTGEISMIKSRTLNGWRLVIPEGPDA